uniref:Uncharacterized protein n=1 Tax=Myripristis murdjan TaxID=586833 RepID=A0A667YFF5_9TELE
MHTAASPCQCATSSSLLTARKGLACFIASTHIVLHFNVFSEGNIKAWTRWNCVYMLQQIGTDAAVSQEQSLTGGWNKRQHKARPALRNSIKCILVVFGMEDSEMKKPLFFSSSHFYVQLLFFFFFFKICYNFLTFFFLLTYFK